MNTPLQAKIRHTLLLAVWLLGATSIYAVTPPPYLRVDHYQACLETQDYGSWQGWCRPTVKPQACPCAAWDALMAQSLPTCPDVHNWHQVWLWWQHLMQCWHALPTFISR